MGSSEALQDKYAATVMDGQGKVLKFVTYSQQSSHEIYRENSLIMP